MKHTPEQVEAYHAGGLSFALAFLDTIEGHPLPEGVRLTQEHIVSLANGLIGNVVQSMVSHGLDPKVVAASIGLDVDVMFVDTEDPAEHGRTTIHSYPKYG